MVPLLWRYLKKHLPMLTANALLVCAQTYLLVIVLMGQMKNIINLGVGAGDMDYIRSSGVRMLLIILVIGACTVGYSYLSAALTADVIGSIRADLSDWILGLSLQDFGRYGGGSLRSRVTSDTISIQLLLINLLRFGCTIPVVLLCMLGVIANISIRLFLPLAAAFALVSLFLFRFGSRARPRYRALSETLDEINQAVGENLQGVRTIRAFRRQQTELEKLDALNEKSRAQSISAGFDTLIVPRIWKNFQWLAAIGTGGFTQYAIRMRKYTGKNIPYSNLNYAASECLMGAARRTGDSSCVLLPDTGFFEFIPIDSKDENTTCTIEELEQGKDYEIVVTNLSGFYRYRIGDVVRVTGFYNEAPTIQFLYRKSQTISIAGEKTNEEAMQWMITMFHEDTGILIRDYSVYPDTDHRPGRYVILIEPEGAIDPAMLPQYRDVVERRLGEANPSFGAKINKGILGRTKLCVVEPETYMLYRDTLVYNGISQNQIKPIRIIDNEKKKQFFFGLIDCETE